MKSSIFVSILLSGSGPTTTTFGFMLPPIPSLQRKRSSEHRDLLMVTTSNSNETVIDLEGRISEITSVVVCNAQTREGLQTSEEERTIEGTSTVQVAALQPYQKEKASLDMELWMKRLITSEDPFSVHKISALTFTVTSFALMGTGVSRWFIGRQEMFATLPAMLEPITYLFCISAWSMCTASIRMAWLHRRNDLASRNAFVGTAGSCIFSAYFCLWASPFAPDFMTTALASQIGFGILCAWNILFVSDTMIRAKELIDGRRDNKLEDENASYALEYLRYIATGAWGLPVVAATGYISCVLHDHAWLVNVFAHNLETYGHGLEASVFFNNVNAAMAAAYGSLFVTLRDKKLISKRAEWLGIVLFALPVLIWTIDVSVRIWPYWAGSMQDVVL